MSVDPYPVSKAGARREVVAVESDLADNPAVGPAIEEHEETMQAGNGMVRRERSVTNAAGDQQREVFVDDVAGSQWLLASKLSQVVWLIIGIIDVLIALRVVLRLLAANPASGFASFIYGASAPFLAPFFGIVGSPAADGSVLEVPSLIALAVYLLIGWLLVQVIWLALDRPSTSSATHYRRFHV